MTPPAIEIAALRYTYPDGSAALDGVDLVAQQGEKLALIGPNGAGKSTLLLHLNGILRGQGVVRILGIPVSEASLRTVRRRVGLVFQNPDDQLFCPTVFDDVAFGPRNLGLSAEEVRGRVARALEAVGLEGLERKSAFHLSLGQKKRAAMATVLAMNADLLALDEPTANLDPRGRREFADLIRRLDGTQIIATHDLELARDLSTRVVLLDNGRLVADGAPENILGDREILCAHGL